MSYVTVENNEGIKIRILTKLNILILIFALRYLIVDIKFMQCSVTL